MSALLDKLGVELPVAQAGTGGAGETASRIHDVRPAADLVRDLAGVGAAR